MGRTIYVQAQADHIESLSKASPISALEELVWNALDAGACEVKVDLITNQLGAVVAVRVCDNGTGVDVLKVENTFGALGGSWKRFAANTPSGARRLHGRHGRGRFKAFALGQHVEWRTTVREGGELLSYVLSGDRDRAGIFELEGAKTIGPATGTEVYIDNVSVNCDSLLDAGETVQQLAAKFALYLKSYPDIRIYFNGIPVTPVIVQKRATVVDLSEAVGAKSKLEIIEWKRKFVGSGKLVLASLDGFELHELPAGVRSGGLSFTAYLLAERLARLNAENALVMDELNPETRRYLDAAKAAIKRHFKAVNEDWSSSVVGNWIREGIYPFDEDDGSPARVRFDKLAVELRGRFEDFEALSVESRALVLKLLKCSSVAVAKGGLKEILKSAEIVPPAKKEA